MREYVSNTFDDINQVKSFIGTSQNWLSGMQAHVDTIKGIKRNETEDSSEKDLGDLTATLQQVKEELRVMENFLEAMEKLAVTSVHVFHEGNPGFEVLSDNLLTICYIILLIRYLDPLLLLFKRNNEAYFQPKLENMEVQRVQLERYIKAVETICERLNGSRFFEEHISCPGVEVKEDLSEDQTKDLFYHIQRIRKIRGNKEDRITYMFQGREQTFLREFDKHESEMYHFLQALEDCADQLDAMSKASNVVGYGTSFMGSTGGILSILGMFFAFFSDGISLALTAEGTLLSVPSGGASVVASVTEIAVNEALAKKAKANIKEFAQSLKAIQCSVDDVIQDHFTDLHKGNVKTGMYSSIPVATLTLDSLSLTGLYHDIKGFLATGESAADPLVEALIFGPPAILFLSFDLYCVYYHTKELLGSLETQTSKLLRARVDLWRTELNSLKNIAMCVAGASLSFEEWKSYVNKRL